MKNNFDPLTTIIPKVLGESALALHKLPGNQLSIECDNLAPLVDAESGIWTIRGSHLEFSSIEVRNQCVAIHSYHENFEPSEEISAAKIFDVAHELWCNEIGNADLACGRFLALSCDRVNVLKAAADLINSGGRYDGKSRFLQGVTTCCTPFICQLALEIRKRIMQIFWVLRSLIKFRFALFVHPRPSMR